MNPPDREIEKRDSIREVKTYLADLDILMPSRKIRWTMRQSLRSILINFLFIPLVMSRLK